MMSEFGFQSGVGSTATYKVFSALITQVGDSRFETLSDSRLTLGVTYQITSNIDVDFTNVGAPNNDYGTYFIATGETPNSWGNEGSLQYNLGAPTVTILENTIGNIWFTYGSTGIYYINSIGLFIQNKIWNVLSPTIFTSYEIVPIDENRIYIKTLVQLVESNNCLTNSSIEIRIYD